MLSSWALFSISVGYVALLFAIAYLGDRRARLAWALSRKPWVYSLALGVYCTSSTFYGAVGRAAKGAWDFFPIYLGPILVFVFGAPLLAGIVRVSKRHGGGWADVLRPVSASLVPTLRCPIGKDTARDQGG